MHMALAASSMISTAAVGAVVLGIAALAVRNIWKRKKAGGGCGCGCSGCSGTCPGKNPGMDRRE